MDILNRSPVSTIVPEDESLFRNVNLIEPLKTLLTTKKAHI